MKAAVCVSLHMQTELIEDADANNVATVVLEASYWPNVLVQPFYQPAPLCLLERTHISTSAFFLTTLHLLFYKLTYVIGAIAC